MARMTVDVTVRGPFFSSRLDQVTKDAIIEESLKPVNERVNRPGRWQQRLGARRNVVTTKQSGLVLDFDSTTIPPRTTGGAWTRKNLGIIRGMLPRVLRKTAQRITEKLD